MIGKERDLALENFREDSHQLSLKYVPISDPVTRHKALEHLVIPGPVLDGPSGMARQAAVRPTHVSSFVIRARRKEEARDDQHG